MPGPMDPRLSFNAAAELYDQSRPEYPRQLFDDLFALIPSIPRVVEVGPGTGQATSDLLGRGATVHAVEIGEALAEILHSKIRSDRLQVSVGDFEKIPTESTAYDLVFSATAYHWISPQAQLDRPADLLRPGGLIGIVDLNQVSSDSDNCFFDAVQPIYDRFNQSKASQPPPRDQVAPRMKAPLLDDPRFDDIEVRSYDWDQTYTADEYRNLMVSYSGTQMMGMTERNQLLDAIHQKIVNDFNGKITRPIVVTLTSARLIDETR